MKILFFTTALEHTTFRKTAMMLQKEGAFVHMLGFNRNNFPHSQKDDISVESLGSLAHGNYLSRMVKLFKFFFILRKKAVDFDVIYNFTLDTLLITYLALIGRGRKKIVYQIQDIRSIYFGNSVRSRVARLLEGRLLKSVDLLVLSSQDFFDGHFKKHYNFDENKIQVIENKLVRGSVEPILNRERKPNKIVIGYFGVMRCLRSWEILRDFAIDNPETIEVYLRGKPDAIPNLNDEIKDLDNVYYGGTYKSPDDLNELYNQVDVVWACYPFSENNVGNWTMARTIRFYEACAFGKPVIVQKGTPQEKDVNLNNIGLVVDMANRKACKDLLSTINKSNLNLWTDKVQKLDNDFYYHSNEFKNLLKRVEEI